MRTRLFTYAIGFAATLAILALIVATRILAEADRPDVVMLHEIDVVDATVAPPPPPPPPPPENPVDQPPPPIAVPELSVSQDLTMPALPVADLPIDPRLVVDTFSIDAPIAAIPSDAPPQVVAKPSPPRRAPVKTGSSLHSLKQLDGKPRLIYSPKVRFPSAAPRSMRSGRVLVKVIIDTNGKTKLHSVVKADHPSFVAAAKRIANSARFTPPQADGKPVKAIMLWPITIRR